MKSFKNIIQELFENDLYFFLLLVVCIFCVYWQVIIKDVILSYDDHILLNSVASIRNLKHYFSSIANGFILDIQPIRDLSFYLDFKIKKLIPHYSFHLTNTLLWVVICHNVRQIFLTQSIKNYYIIGLLVLIYATSPVSANSVAWIAARKHLLSTLFITYATLLTIRNRDSLSTINSLLISFLFLLSCFSHPINTLWILWLIYYLYPERIHQKKILIALSSLCFLISMSANFYYYKFTYAQNVSAVSKFMNYRSLDLGDPLLAIGRYFYQCLFPFAALPSPHYQGSWENLVGLALLVFFLTFCLRKIKTNSSSVKTALIYFFFPLLLVTINMTNVFCSDTYLLNSSIGFYWAILIIAENFKSTKYTIATLTLYFFSVIIYSFNYVDIFLNEDQMWLYSYKKEATSQTSVIASSIYVKKKMFHESYKVIEEIQLRWPNQPYLPQVIAENVFFNPRIINTEKIKTLQQIRPAMPSTYFYLSIIYGYEKDIESLKSTLFKIFENPVEFNMEFHGNEDKIASIFLYSCLYFKLQGCENHLEKFKHQVRNHEWDNVKIEQYVKQLQAQPEFSINI